MNLNNVESLPPNFKKEYVTSFLVENWFVMAKLAYSSYLEQGKGLVLWYWDIEEIAAKLIGYYPKAKLIENNFGDKALAMIDYYDPEVFVAVGLTWEEKEPLDPNFPSSTYYLLAKIDNLPSPRSIYLQTHN